MSGKQPQSSSRGNTKVVGEEEAEKTVQEVQLQAIGMRTGERWKKSLTMDLSMAVVAMGRDLHSVQQAQRLVGSSNHNKMPSTMKYINITPVYVCNSCILPRHTAADIK